MSDLEIDEESVNLPALLKTLKRAFYKASIDEDGDLRVETDGPTIFVSIEKSNNLIKLYGVYVFSAEKMTREKLELANRINDRIVFVRFAISESNPKLILADYHLPFDGGLSEFQFISAIRLFARVVPHALREMDTDNLLL